MIKERFKAKDSFNMDEFTKIWLMDFKEDFDLSLKKMIENTIKKSIKDTYEETERAITNIENLINKL
ncbi:TPA: hypothetical protein OUL15_002822 [Clostridioides difficile]|uniref:hypothetical protein n=1 Tax=Clostridioides difficile TaxID=1496 RepID=UPI00093F11A0|nr:hypothetical protein [Clostridioides difficile]EGT4582918.1 hypothetical protein [Clostridioides difficile]EGT5085639.1 hypothetical protein [Clostridioides difficile]EGT5455935.1 hypothetical protein [Clostridioides difficile]EGT5501027.1 hypothetical protein [Clostridioides difficile]EIS9446846.1 hypothetical protein [Clostridioides difficile]